MNNLRFVSLLLIIFLVVIALPVRAGQATAGAGDELFPPYLSLSTVLSEAAGDPYEPNDGFGTATEISNPAFLLFDFLTIDPPGDLDYFRFQGRAGDEVNFYLVENSPLEAVLTLYDANLRLLAEDNDAAGNNDGVATFVHELPESGDYYVRVKDNRHPAAGGEDFTYSLSVHLNETGEPNDDFTLATPMVYGDLVRAYLFLELGPDIDTYTFTGEQGDFIYTRLWADDLSEALDLCLYGPEQTELVCDNFLMNYELPSGGSYYLQVTGLYPGNYSLYLWLADPIDVFEPNDDRLQATPIALDQTLDAALEAHDGVEFWEDKDYYQFSGLVGQSLLAAADSAVFGSMVYPDLVIEDAGGNVLHSALASTTRTELAFTLPSSGSYYVSVSAACGEGGAGCQGGYQLQVSKTNEPPRIVYLPVTVYSGDLERDALVAFYDHMNGDLWTHHDNWLSSTISYCNWFGVACDSEGHVKSIDLVDNKLWGSIPRELSDLSHLMVLDLGWNQIEGSIPPELGSLSRLETLVLAVNQLSGSIPPELGDLSRLTYLDLGSNQLVGSIPPELGQLTLLEDFRLYTNQLSGLIPPEIGDLSQLSFVELYGNQLSGPVPHELSSLSQVDWLRVNDNQLTCWDTQAVLDWALNIRDHGQRANWDYPNPGEAVCQDQPEAWDEFLPPPSLGPQDSH